MFIGIKNKRISWMILVLFCLFILGCMENVKNEEIKEDNLTIQKYDILEETIEEMKNKTFYCKRAARDPTAKWADCYMSIAKELKEEAVCEKISESHLKINCYMGIAILKENINICDQMSNDTLTERCYKRLRSLQDPCGINFTTIKKADCSTPKNTLSTFLTGTNTNNIDLELACFPDSVVISTYCRESRETIIITKDNLTEELIKKRADCSPFYFTAFDWEIGLCKREGDNITCCGNTIQPMDGCFSISINEFSPLFTPKCILNNTCDTYAIIVLSDLGTCSYANEKFCNQTIPYFIDLETLHDLNNKCHGLQYVLIMSEKGDEWLIDKYHTLPVT